MPELPSDIAKRGASVIPFPGLPGLERARGTARIGFVRRGFATAIEDLFQSGCAKVCLPRREPGRLREAVLVNTAGGLTDGDRLRNTVSWDRGASAAVTSQAAERIYRSRRGPAYIETELTLAKNATALWLPQETILFDGGNLSRRTEVELDPTARLIACESLILGRTAMGEAIRTGAVLEAWRISVEKQLVFADTLRLGGDIAKALDRPAVGHGARAFATVIYAGPDAVDRVDVLHDVAAELPGARVAASCLGPVTVARILAETGQGARHALSAVLAALLQSVAGEVESTRLPRIWSC